MARRDINAAGLALVKSYESFVPFVYDDLRPVKGVPYGYREWDGSKPKGTLTIGYGHTDDAQHPLKIRKGLRITEPEACAILDADLDECEDRVARTVKVPLTDNQFAALVSFDFNTGAIGRASFVKALNRGDYGAVRPGLMQWVKSKGQTLRGLERRREAEGALFTRKAVARVVEPIAAGAGVPTGTVVPDAPVEEQPLSQSGVIQGTAAASVPAGGFTADKALEVIDQAQGGIDRIQAGTVLGLIAGLVILGGLAYAAYSRAKAAGKLPRWWPTWLGGEAARAAEAAA
ncbi:lysozyme [Xanthobacter flavus]|uniref:lysozyme n=1 Tax=Xanthobacter flavus TaxID=281 RepID=UPI001AEA82A3|nr:lysozyme [Xanthobacter flavus]MBP2147390.1 GH24 family phage-related lysozyme (muramidase) [Xanthobacter flavus]